MENANNEREVAARGADLKPYAISMPERLPLCTPPVTADNGENKKVSGEETIQKLEHDTSGQLH